MSLTFDEIIIRKGDSVSKHGRGTRGWWVTAFHNGMAHESYTCSSLSGAVLVVTCLFSGLPVPRYYFKAKD